MISVPISSLPESITETQAVEAVYADELFTLARHLKQGRSMIVRMEKHMQTNLTRAIRTAIRDEIPGFEIINGQHQDPSHMMAVNRAQAMVQQFSSVVSDISDGTVFVFPYLDVLTSSHAGVTQETRDILTLIHENPRTTILAYEDPSMPFPEMVVQAFFSTIEMIGTPRKTLHRIITRVAGKRFGSEVLPVRDLSRFLSGKSPVEIVRIMDYFASQVPLAADNRSAYRERIRELRELTVSGDTGLSSVNLQTGIAGYQAVKDRISAEILSLLERAQATQDEEEVAQIEELLPRGLILYGPPGTGKTLFSRGIAEAIQGTVHVVNGPELKSKFVGESEGNIRRIFSRARANAPAVIVFDELDSIAGKRDGDSGSQEANARSIVNQLLTEMDGFRREELVFVVGTTNLPELLDPALLRPGRFGLSIEIAYPGTEDRATILRFYNSTLSVNLDEETVDELTRWTGRNTDRGTPYAGDDIRALCYALKRWMLRSGTSRVSKEDVIAWLQDEEKRERGPGDDRALRLDMVAGYDEVKGELAFQFLERVDAAERADSSESRLRMERLIPRGILLHGPPGTGKTYLARALAGSAGYRTIFVSGPELKSKWVGGSEERVRSLFARAKANTPAAIILDELDSIAETRETAESGGGEAGSEGILLQLLSEITRLEPHDRVIIIATTNRPDRVDPALLRPGRIGVHVSVGYPDAGDREAILLYLAREISIDLTEDALRTLVAFTGGMTLRGTPYSADDLRDLIASVAAVGGAPDGVEITRFLEEKYHAHRMATPDLRRIAVHEAGHVCAAALDGRADTIHRVRLSVYNSNSGGGLGAAEFLGEKHPFETESSVRIEIRGILAATIAEELVYGSRSSGCAQDLVSATELATRLVARYGMSDHPTLRSFIDDRGDVSPFESSRIGTYADAILAAEETTVRESLRNHIPAIEALAEALVSRLTLEGDEVRALLENLGVVPLSTS